MNYRMRVASVYLLGFFIDLVNMFIANVAYPEISRRFDASVSQLAWISNGYILGLTIVIPLSSWLIRRAGAKRIFIFTLLIFIFATCGVGASSSVSQLITWRWIQGIGGGLLIPVGQTMTYALYQSHERAKLSSVVMLIALLAPALSPAMGGVLVDSFSWRWVFLTSLPLAVLALVLASLWLKADMRAESPERLDLLGLTSGCAALILILLGLTYLGEPHHLNQGALMLLIGIFGLTGYIWNALKQSRPLLNLRLVKEPLLHTAMLIYQFVPGIFTGVSMLTMLYLQNLLGMRASFVGALMLPWSLAAFAAISLTGKKFNIWGPRPLFIAGCVIQASGIGVLSLTGRTADAIVCVLAFALMGFGSSLCSSTAQSSAFLQIPASELADASALWNINRQLSFCLGVTLINLLFNLIANTGLPPLQAYHLCFVLAACSAVIPVLCCFRIANQSILLTVNQEQK
ncbi:MFS transporter [Pantoea piersonii]|uniref:MFS transporter n=1 Tax=Pantoea piersonii TaxID=2364647 RepID=UPI0028A2B16F|nr:MFS transporter [Pantoea piersonii]